MKINGIYDGIYEYTGTTTAPITTTWLPITIPNIYPTNPNGAPSIIPDTYFTTNSTFNLPSYEFPTIHALAKDRYILEYSWAKYYYYKGLLHRANGKPAVEYKDSISKNEYWVKGIKLFPWNNGKDAEKQRDDARKILDNRK